MSIKHTVGQINQSDTVADVVNTKCNLLSTLTVINDAFDVLLVHELNGPCECITITNFI